MFTWLIRLMIRCFPCSLLKRNDPERIVGHWKYILIGEPATKMEDERKISQTFSIRPRCLSQILSQICYVHRMKIKVCKLVNSK
jgi:hypothetical protein